MNHFKTFLLMLVLTVLLVIVGSAIGVSEHWSYGGRFPIFLANLPNTIAAKFVDQQCGSAIAGIHIGFMEIAQGFADTLMVGGMEHMTRVAMGAVAKPDGPISPNLRLFMDPTTGMFAPGPAGRAIGDVVTKRRALRGPADSQAQGRTHARSDSDRAEDGQPAAPA